MLKELENREDCRNKNGNFNNDAPPFLVPRSWFGDVIDLSSFCFNGWSSIHRSGMDCPIAASSRLTTGPRIPTVRQNFSCKSVHVSGSNKNIATISTVRWIPFLIPLIHLHSGLMHFFLQRKPAAKLHAVNDPDLLGRQLPSQFGRQKFFTILHEAGWKYFQYSRPTLNAAISIDPSAMIVPQSVMFLMALVSFPDDSSASFIFSFN